MPKRQKARFIADVENVKIVPISLPPPGETVVASIPPPREVEVEAAAEVNVAVSAGKSDEQNVLSKENEGLQASEEVQISAAAEEPRERQEIEVEAAEAKENEGGAEPAAAADVFETVVDIPEQNEEVVEIPEQNDEAVEIPEQNEEPVEIPEQNDEDEKRLNAEREAREEKERIAREKREAKQREKERRAAEKERIAAEKAEQQRIERERIEEEQREKERQEKAKLDQKVKLIFDWFKTDISLSPTWDYYIQVPLVTYPRGQVNRNPVRRNVNRYDRSPTPEEEEFQPTTRRRKRRSSTKRSAKRRKKQTKKERIESLRVGDRITMHWPPTNSWSHGEILLIYNGLDEGSAPPDPDNPDLYFKIAFNDDTPEQGPLVYKLDDYKFKVLKYAESEDDEYGDEEYVD